MAVGVAMMVGAMATDPVQSGPKPCPPTTPGPDGKNKCPLAAPKDAEFSTVCHPGALGWVALHPFHSIAVVTPLS